MRRIPLKRRDGRVVAHAVVDDGDFAWLSQWTWRLHCQGYATRKERGVQLLMHRELLGLRLGDPRQGDHRNRDKLNNRRANLRVAPRAELDNGQNQGLSSRNRSGYRGVCWDGAKGRWRAYCQYDGGRLRNLGYFSTAEGADAEVRAFRAAHMPFSEEAA